MMNYVFIAIIGFKKNYISQQEQLRRCGIFSNYFITNFAQNVLVKN